MAQIYQKREIVLLDIHNRISKDMIDDVLKKNGYHLSSSKIDNRPNVEFINADVANDVKKFFDNKELIYNNRPFKFSVKGNRFIIGGMYDVPFDKIKNFFQSYGEVHNVYTTKRYFATLASIQQAIELVEKVKTIKIDNTPVEIKYAFDHNIGNSVSSNKNFKLKVKDNNTKTGEFVIKNKVLLNDPNSKQNINIELSKPINIELGGNRIKNANSTSRLNLNDVDKSRQPSKNRTNQYSGNQQNNQQQDQKNRRRRDRRRNRSSSSQSDATQQLSELDLNKQTKYKHVSRSNLQDGFKKSEQSNTSRLVDPKVNSLKMSNPNMPLFSKGPSSNSSSIFEKLDHKNDQFKSINYLNDKIKQQEEKQSTHVTTTYFNSSTNNERQQNDTNIPTVLPFQRIATNQNSNNFQSLNLVTESAIENKIYKPSSTVTPLTSSTSNTSATQAKPASTNQKNTNFTNYSTNHTQSAKPKTYENATSYNSQNDSNKQKNYSATRQESIKKEGADNCNII